MQAQDDVADVNNRLQFTALEDVPGARRQGGRDCAPRITNVALSCLEGTPFHLKMQVPYVIPVSSVHSACFEKAAATLAHLCLFKLLRQTPPWSCTDPLEQRSCFGVSF